MDNDNQNQDPQVDWQLQYAAVSRTCTALANQNLDLLKQRGLLEELNSKLGAENNRLTDENQGLRYDLLEAKEERLGLESDLSFMNRVEERLREKLETAENQIKTLCSYIEEYTGIDWVDDDVVVGIIEQWAGSDDEVVAVELRSEGDDNSNES